MKQTSEDQKKKRDEKSPARNENWASQTTRVEKIDRQRQAGRETATRAGRETDRQADSQSDRQTVFFLPCD